MPVTASSLILGAWREDAPGGSMTIRNPANLEDVVG